MRLSDAIRSALALACLWLLFAPARGFELRTGTDLQVRWDNTVKYSAAWRVHDRSPTLAANVNADDGNRNFDRGLIANRADLLSEIDLAYKQVGARFSGAAWYDAAYHRSTDNESPTTANSFSVPHNEFPRATTRLHGRKAEVLDAFVFGKGHVGAVPASFRAGRHTLLWGESLLIADNGISYAQAPLDGIKGLSVPGSQAKELFLPVGQVSGQLRPSTAFSIAAYYQYQWRRTRIPAAGSYFSRTDVLDAGGERLLSAPAPSAFFRGADLSARDSGQWGISARYRADAIDTEFGLYYIRFHDKVPQLYLQPGVRADPSIGKIGEYVLVFPEDIRLIGASFVTTVRDVSIAGEAHVRRNTPLASLAGVVTPGAVADNRTNPLYAVGNTVHAQLSATAVLPRTTLWESATVLGEVGWQRYIAITRNRSAFDPNRDHQAWGFRLLLSPTYFQVLPNLDISVPMTYAYNPKGRSPIAGFNGGAHKGGSASIGIAGEYQKVWMTSVQFTHFHGSEISQGLRDRDFFSFSLQRAF